MQRRKFTSGVVSAGGLWLLAASASASAEAAGITESDAALGVRAALERGAASAIALLGRSGGFLDNPKVRIPLPGFLNEAAKLLRYTGQQKRVDELVTAMNRAAEAAVPQAKTLLTNAVRAMSVEDGKQILTGGDNAVTNFFASKTRAPLSVTFLPIVTKATERVALADKYNSVAGKAASLGLLKQDDANIQQYVTGKTLDGLYLMIGEEERKIRRDPIGTGSAILQKVFGSLR
jgi:predicted outer membrane protein